MGDRCGIDGFNAAEEAAGIDTVIDVAMDLVLGDENDCVVDVDTILAVVD